MRCVRSFGLIGVYVTGLVFVEITIFFYRRRCLESSSARFRKGTGRLNLLFLILLIDYSIEDPPVTIHAARDAMVNAPTHTLPVRRYI